MIAVSKSPLAPALLAFFLAFAMGTTRAANGQDQAQQCGDLVAKIYRDTWPKGVAPDGGVVPRMEAHYNAKLDKCLFLETVSGSWRSPALKRILPREMQRLGDAFENKNLGKFDAWNDEPPVACWVQDKKCGSKQEWQQLIRPYLSD